MILLRSANRFPEPRVAGVRRLRLLMCLALFLAVAIPTSSPAQAVPPGTIKGFVHDRESGEELPYTNVYIAGTNIGTMAFNDGYFIMRGLPPGTYTVKASYISYALGSEMVTLGPGEIVEIDFQLEVQAIMMDPFDVEAERRLIEVERTGSSHFLSGKQMDAMPLDQVVDMIAHQPGVTIYDNEIHIRGGRADDTQFIIDGMSVNDPLAGGGYGYQIDPSLINEIEVLTGGFNAEYGQAVSGVVNVSTKEGGDRFGGKVSLKRDYLNQPVPKDDYRHWRDLYDFGEPQNIDIFKLTLSGPDPFSTALRQAGLGLPGEQFLLVSGAMDIRDGYLPIYSRQNQLQSPLYEGNSWTPRQDNNWNGLAKWSWHITPSHKLNLTSSRQVGISQGFQLPGEGYPRPFIDNLDNYMVFTTENILTQLYYRQVLSDNDWFELQLGRNFNRLHANLNGNDGDVYGPDPFQGYMPIDYDSDDPARPAYGSADRWHDHFTESYTLKGSYSFMKNSSNQFKTGLEISFTEMQLIDLNSELSDPPSGKLGIDEDIFSAHPVVGSAFFQDTINFRGLIVNAGLRTDFWAPGREVEEVISNHEDYLFIYPDMVEEFEEGTMGVMGRRWKVRISPRLGLSFPVTERDKFFFNYGHFSQWPRFAYVYPQLRAQTAVKVQQLGNPNLDPKITVEYETGIQHEFGGLWSLGVTFFNRDIYGYAKSVGLDEVHIGAAETPDPNDIGTITISPVRYFNGDSARSLGMEISVIKRTTRYLSGSASLELQSSTGTNSRADEAYLQAIYDEAYQPTASIGGLKRTPLLWDKPWTVSVNLDYSVFEDSRPEARIPYP
ncbi:MAG: TonB-dependent receptor, partial [bacterium]